VNGANLIARHCEERSDEAIQSFFPPKDGLLRFARNDGNVERGPMNNVPKDPDTDVFTVPEEHRAAVLEGLRQAERGEYASDKEMAALWKKYGL
jgi:hypothetical protein